MRTPDFIRPKKRGISVTASRRNRTQRLFIQQEGYCHWCGYEMILEPRHDHGRNGKMLVTLDHIGKRNGGKRPAVAAHRICNNERQHKIGIPDETLSRIQKTAVFLKLIQRGDFIPVNQ